MAAPPLVRVVPLLRLRIRLHNHRHLLAFSPICHPLCSSAARPEDVVLPSGREVVGVKDKVDGLKLFDDQNYRKWKDKEEEILRDIEPITLLAKHILHSNRYMDGERLTYDDEKAVAEKLLAYHPHSVDKIGCGLDSIMVDRHPQYRQSRCLFVVRTDGGWIDFSYQKCLREYIRSKYPSHAERFIREHFKRSRG